MNESIDLLFYPKPEQWGLRGDPFLWVDLENHIRTIKLPDSTQDFSKLLFHLYKQLVGILAKGDESIYVEKYKYIGMSSGMVSSKFWLEKGFPILLERFSKLPTLPYTKTNGA